TIANLIAGTGRLVQNGNGTLILTARSEERGVGKKNRGRLQPDHSRTNGARGSGNGTNSTDMTFNRSDAGTMGNLIAGHGRVEQNGSGTAILTGNNPYSGFTIVSAGTLQVGAGGVAGTLGSGAATISAWRAVVRCASVTIANLIAGTGRLVQNGNGTLILTA